MLPHLSSLIYHILSYFSHFYPPSCRNRLLQLPEADVPKGCWIQITSISAYRKLLCSQICSPCLNTCCERQNLNLNRYQKSYGSHCLTPPNPDLSQLLISADRNIKVLEERIPHEIGRNMLTWPLVTCSIIIFQFQTGLFRLQWMEIQRKSGKFSRWSQPIVNEKRQSETEK